jgi:hypothetical protein
MIAMLGMCIYITIAILPLYYQEILGYTAFTAGLVVGPRGIGSFIGSPIIGFLGSRIDNRKLLCAGFLGFAVCSFIFGRSISTSALTRCSFPSCSPVSRSALSLCRWPPCPPPPSPKRHGQRHRPLQHAAQHRRVNWNRDGHHRDHPPRRSAPDRAWRQLSPSSSAVLQQKSA